MDRGAHAIGSDVVVIGYGNPIRSDDSVGPRAAAAVRDWALPGVRAIEVQQLTPELVEPLACACLAIFVDARRTDADESVHVQPLELDTVASMSEHSWDPRGLLALAQAIFGSRPKAWLVTVPATNFAVGDGLSPTAESGLQAALETIATMLHHQLQSQPHGMLPAN